MTFKPREEHYRWRGGIAYTGEGYREILIENSGKGRRRYKLEHLMIAEKALGKALPSGALVHHANGMPSDNRHENLVICQDNFYHMMLHRRTKAFQATGNANSLRCTICGKWELPGASDISVTRRIDNKTPSIRARHRSCVAKWARERKKR